MHIMNPQRCNLLCTGVFVWEEKQTCDGGEKKVVSCGWKAEWFCVILVGHLSTLEMSTVQFSHAHTDGLWGSREYLTEKQTEKWWGRDGRAGEEMKQKGKLTEKKRGSVKDKVREENAAKRLKTKTKKWVRCFRQLDSQFGRLADWKWLIHNLNSRACQGLFPISFSDQQISLPTPKPSLSLLKLSLGHI